MNTSLLTFDGFPRSDIDVAQIRTTRARIITLKNDHKALMVKLEEAVHEHFAAGKSADLPAQAGALANGPGNVATSASGAPVAELPFAKVNAVSPGSPAELANLQPGDKVVKFGPVDFSNHERLSKVAQVVQQNENVRARRSSVNCILTLTAYHHRQRSATRCWQCNIVASSALLDPSTKLGRPRAIRLPFASFVRS